MSTKLGSIVVPAHNEATVIERTLRALVDGLDISRVEMVIACNGCSDDTAAVVRSLDLPLEVLELGPVGKVGALRAAERHITALPRLYVDADVVLPGNSARAVLEALANGAVAARPPIEFDVNGASWAVRRFAACRAKLPGVMHELCGAGVYGLSAIARARFDEFPDLTADDLYVARMVHDSEVTIVPCTPVKVALPRTTRALVHTLGRVYRGNAELGARLTDDARPSTSRTSRDLAHLLRSPFRWVDVGVYVAFGVAGRFAARRGTTSAWERDDTARQPVAVAP